jgi:hypothetical protein
MTIPAVDRLSNLCSIMAHNENGNGQRIAQSLHGTPKVVAGSALKWSAAILPFYIRCI